MFNESKIITAYLDSKSRGEKVKAPKINFTQALLQWLPTKEFDYEILHSQYPGLRCRVRKGGSKTIVLIKRIKGGNLKRVTFCRVGEQALDDVIKQYQKAIGEIKKMRSEQELSEEWNNYVKELKPNA